MSRPYKVIFAAGGTGGHLFPAQGLAEQLRAKKVELLFAGAKLSENAYFDKTQFPFCDIASMTPFRKNIFQALKSLWHLFMGISQSLSLLSEKKPDLIIGFGSFHSFPILCAAVIKKVPLVLFESNSIPGKVIRLFAKRAIVTATYFEETKRHLKGETVEVEIPIRSLSSRQIMAQEEARKLLGPLCSFLEDHKGQGRSTRTSLPFCRCSKKKSIFSSSISPEMKKRPIKSVWRAHRCRSLATSNSSSNRCRSYGMQPILPSAEAAR
jgi:hypothetical protein